MVSVRSRNVLKKAVRSNAAGNELADIMGGIKQITEINIGNAVETELKEISQLVCPANVASVKEISQLVCPQDASVKEISQLICPAQVADVKEITDVTAVGETGVQEITDLIAVAETGTNEVTNITAVQETGRKEVTAITAVADVGGNLDGLYFILYDDVGSVAFWIDVDNSGTVEPAHGADRSVEIQTITTGALIGAVGTAVYNTIISDSKFGAGSDDTAGNITVKSSTFGVKLDGSPGTSTFTVLQSVAGADSLYDGKYFLMQDRDGSVAFWFDVDNDGTVEPSHGADRSVEITTITDNMAIGAAGTAIYNAVIGDSEFEAGSDDAGGNLTIKCSTAGVRTDGTAGDSPLTVVQGVAGVDSNYNGKYFTLTDKDGSVAFWFDVDNDGTAEPSHGADRAVEITTITTAMAIGAVGTAIYNAIIGDSQFGAGSDDAAGHITVKDAFSGARLDAGAGDSPLIVSEDTTGVNSNYDGKYFILYDDSGSVAFWFDADSRGTVEPSHGADRAVEIATVTIGMTAGQAGTAIYNAVTGDADFEAGSDDTAGNLTIQCATAGIRTDGNSGDSPLTVAESTPGVTENYDGLYFVMQDSAGSVAFWIDVDDSGTAEPVHGAARSVEVTTITTGMTAGQAGTALYNAIIGDAKFEAGSDDTAGTLLIQNAEYGSFTDISAGTSYIAVSVDTQGVDSNYDGTYIVLQDDAGSVAFWIDVDDSGTAEPGHGADRSIEVTTITSAMAAGALGTALYTAIIGDAEFEAGSDDAAGTILVQNADAGVRPDISAGTSPIAVSIDTEGADNYSDTYVLLYDDAGSVAFWFDIDDAGQSIPAGASAADRAVEVTTVTSGMTAGQVGTALYTKMIADAQFEAGSDDTAGTILVQSATKGLKSDIDAGTSPIAVSVSQQGLDALLDGQYIILLDEVGTVAFWIDIDDAGTVEPSHGADRSVEVTTITSGMTAEQAITALYTVIVADSKFEAGTDSGGGYCLVQSTTGGVRVGQSSSNISVIVVQDNIIGKADGGTLSDDTSYILRIALAKAATDAYFTETKAAFEAGTGTSLSAEALRVLKIMLADNQANTEISALYA